MHSLFKPSADEKCTIYRGGSVNRNQFVAFSRTNQLNQAIDRGTKSKPNILWFQAKIILTGPQLPFEA